MTKKRRNGDILSLHHLRREECISLRARTDTHENALARVQPDFVNILQHDAGESHAPLVALFTNQNRRQRVSLTMGETLYVLLPEERLEISVIKTQIEDEDNSIFLSTATQIKKKADNVHTEPKEKKQRREHKHTWIPLRIVGHSAYVGGLTRAGIAHSAIVHLERDQV